MADDAAAAERLRGAEPLRGRRVVVTRPREQAAALVAALEGYGAEVLAVPVIEIVPAPLDDAFRDAVARLAETDIIVFTSANGVRCFVDRLGEAGAGGAAAGPGLAATALAHAELVAIGPATAAALEERGLAPALVPDEFVAESLVAALRGRGRPLAGARVLVPSARRARDVLPAGLRAEGAAVTVLPVYDTQPAQALPAGVDAAAVLAADYVTFTSSSTVDAFIALAAPAGAGATYAGTPAAARLSAMRLCSIGPVTSDTIRRHGFEPAVEAPAATAAALAAAIAAHVTALPREAHP